MNTSLTEIAFILDRSGSMQPLAEQAVTGFNSFLAEQQQAKGKARITLVLFDHEYVVPASCVPVEEVLPLDMTTYVPRGCTALLDAIGRTIDDLGARLAALPESDRPATVIVAILTDGEENSSRQFTWHDVSDRIRHQTDVYKWNFLFLGANQDAIATAANLHIDRKNASTFAADGVGLRASTAALAKKMAAYRSMSLGCASPLEQATIDEPLSDAVADEDRKRRGK